MKKVLKRSLAMLLCVCILALTGILAGAIDVTPVPDPESVKMSQSTLTMEYGKTAKLSATVLPAGADQGVKWTSSNPALVSVDANGNLTAAKDKADAPSGKQTVTITATSTAKSSLSDKCVVTVDNDATTKTKGILITIINALKSIMTLVFTNLSGAKEPLTQLVNTLIDMIKKLAGGTTPVTPTNA